MLSLWFAVHMLCQVQLFAAPWTAARQASLYFTISQSLLILTCFESVMPSNHLILCHPLLLLFFSIHSNLRHISLFYFSFIKLKISYHNFFLLPMSYRYQFPIRTVLRSILFSNRLFLHIIQIKIFSQLNIPFFLQPV